MAEIAAKEPGEICGTLAAGGAVSVYDPLSFGAAVGVLALGTLLAYYLPARRSTKVEPAAVLREE